MKKMLVWGFCFLVSVLLLGCAVKEAPAEEPVEGAADNLGNDLQSLDDLDHLTPDFEDDGVVKELEELEKLNLE